MEIETKIIEMRVRPKKILFFIPSKSNFDLCRQIIDYNCTIWGGKDSLIIPTNGKYISEIWWKLIDCSNPDLIYSFLEIEPHFQEELIERIFPFDLIIHKSSSDVIFSDNLEKWYENSSNLRIFPRYVFIANQNIDEKRHFKIYFPYDIDNSVWKNYLHAMFGRFPVEFESNFVKNNIKHTVLNFRSKDLLNILDHYLEYAKKTPLDLTDNCYKYFYNVFRENCRIFLISREEEVETFCLFWNLRAVNPFIELIWFPFDYINNEERVKKFKTWILKKEKESSKISNLVWIYSSEINNQQIKKLEPLFKPEISLGKIDENVIINFIPEAMEFYEKETSLLEEKFFVKNKSKVKCLQPSFLTRSLRKYGKWVVDIFIKSSDKMPNSILLPKRVGLSELFVSFEEKRRRSYLRRADLRISKGGLSCAISQEDDLLLLELPSPEIIFKVIFQNKNFIQQKTSVLAKDTRKQPHYNIEISDKGKYTKEAINLFGSLEEVRTIFKTPGIIQILDSFILDDKGKKIKNNRRKRLSYLEIASYLCLNNELGFSKHECEDISKNLCNYFVKKGIFLRGFQAKCKSCNNFNWYRIDNLIGDKFKCSRCEREGYIPIEAEWAYSLNEIFFQFLYHDGIVPLLTLARIRNNSKDSFIFSPEILILNYGNKKKEIDICCLSDSKFIFGECKRKGKIKKQELKFYKNISKILRPEILIFATIDDAFCKIEKKDCLICMKERFCSDNAFSSSSSSNEFSTRESIQEIRNELKPLGIEVCTFCRADLLGIRKSM